MKSISCLLFLSLGTTAGLADNWHQFRGPTGMGVADGEVPTRWSKGSVAWKTELPGEGQSSAVNWGPIHA